MGAYYGYMILGAVLTALGMFVSSKLKSKFSTYSQMGLSSGLTGKEVAEQMLAHYGIHDVQVVAGKGMLTDHYNPRTKTISLSEPVYGQRSVAAAAVAAHECGHAVQHAEAYQFLEMRSAIVPVVNIAASFQQYALMAGFFLLGSMPSIMLIAIGLFAATTLFSFITLPVEFDASKRAMAWLDSSNVTPAGPEYDGAKDALKWAAMTYVVAAISSLAMLVYLVLQYMGSRD